MNPSSYLKVLQNTKYSVILSKALAGVDVGEERSGSGPRPYFTPNWDPAKPRTQFFLRGLKIGLWRAALSLLWKIEK